MSSQKSKDLCNKCGKIGHQTSDCWSKKKMEQTKFDSNFTSEKSSRNKSNSVRLINCSETLDNTVEVLTNPERISTVFDVTPSSSIIQIDEHRPAKSPIDDFNNTATNSPIFDSSNYEDIEQQLSLNWKPSCNMVSVSYTHLTLPTIYSV